MLPESQEYRKEIISPEGTMRLRPVESSNLADLIILAEATGLSPWTARCYLQELRDPNSIMLRLLGDDNGIVGFVVGRLVPAASESAESDAEIYNIAIRPSSQRKGSGDIIFRAFLEICSNKGVDNIWLEVRESNYTAISFYLQKGFSVIQKRPGFYSNPPDNALVMKLSVRKAKLDK
jgi:[ribosomal protein S18]-alanine N-acetyltransferase